jgi:hypothetical protein
MSRRKIGDERIFTSERRQHHHEKIAGAEILMKEHWPELRSCSKTALASGFWREIVNLKQAESEHL